MNAQIKPSRSAARPWHGGVALAVDMPLLDSLQDGVVLLNRSGQVTDFNRAARPWLRACANAHQQLARHIEHWINQPTTGPLAIAPFDPTDPAMVALKFHLCRNGPQDYALIIAPEQAKPQDDTRPETVNGIMALLAESMRHELTQWRAELALDAPAAAEPSPGPSSLAQSSERLSRLLVTFEQLASISQDAMPSQSERLSLMTLAQEALSAMPQRRANYALMVAPDGAAQQHGMLYGHAELLRCGLRGLLESLDDGAPSHSQIELWVRQSGRHVVLNSRFASGSALRPRRPAIAALSRDAPALHLEADLRLPLARRIVELHGGQLSTEPLEAAPGRPQRPGIAAFTLVLPTGASGELQRRPECADCPTSQQAEAYARDLASLMFRPDSAADVSGEEIAFLMNMITNPPAPETGVPTP